MSKKKAIIFDFNDTLRDKESGKTNKKTLKKAVNAEKREHLIVLSGESPDKKAKTKNWLKSHDLGKAELEVRPAGNTEPDDKEKEHMLNAYISRQFKVNTAYDDKKSNRKMFKRHGIDAKNPK